MPSLSDGEVTQRELSEAFSEEPDENRPEIEPLLAWPVDGVDVAPEDPDDVQSVASNDEWAFRMADRMVATLPQKEGKDRRTEGEVFDHQTLLTLHKFLSSGVLKSLDFPISTGKEANVFRGTTPMGGLVAVKIFRTNTATFKHVLKYIQGDERFAGISGDKRTLVHAWAQKEFRNLHRMRDAGVDVPEPIQVRHNVLVMEYIGTEEGPCPTLKELGRIDKAKSWYAKLSKDIIAIVDKAGLVHADLSEFNILIQDAGTRKARPRIIDVGQGVLRNHPMSMEFLTRDIKNFTAYFKRQQLKVTEQDLMQRLNLEAFE